MFNDRHPDRHVHHGYILELVAKFRQTGSVANKKRIIENPVRNEAVEVAVLGQVSMNPTLSTRKMSDVTGIMRTTLRRILKHYKWHPYKIQLLQELNEDDNDRRLQFSEVMSEQVLNYPNYQLLLRRMFIFC